MPCKKNPQPPSICIPSSRRLLETMAIRDLPQNEIICVPSLNQDSRPGPSECGPCACNENDCAPGVCCATDHQCEPRTDPEQTKVIETCLPSCKSLEIEAMIDEMKRSQQIIRTLALEAMEILHSEHDCPMCKQDAQAQTTPNAKEPYCEHCKKTNQSEPTNQSRTKFLAMPSTPLQSCAHSRTSSVPIAQTAFQIKEGRLPKTDNIEDTLKKKNKVDIDMEESLKKKSKTEEEKHNVTLPDYERYNPPYLEASRNCLQKMFGSKPSTCSCDGEKNLDINCTCKGKIDCRCGSKSYFQKLFGKKPSVCSCNEDPVEKNEENEDRSSKSYIKKICKKKVDCYCPFRTDDKDKMDKQNKDNSDIEKRKPSVDDVGQVGLRKSSLAASFGSPNCDKDICQCHYPPSYNQYFSCTGQVTGNCSCDKNV